MKALIRAACVCVIIFVGYYFWGEYNRHLDRQRDEALAQKVMCQTMIDDFKSGKNSQKWIVAHVASCIRSGDLSESDFDSEQLQQIYQKAEPLIK